MSKVKYYIVLRTCDIPIEEDTYYQIIHLFNELVKENVRYHVCKYENHTWLENCCGQCELDLKKEIEF